MKQPPPDDDAEPLRRPAPPPSKPVSTFRKVVMTAVLVIAFGAVLLFSAYMGLILFLAFFVRIH
jgi:hypothetical protein